MIGTHRADRLLAIGCSVMVTVDGMCIPRRELAPAAGRRRARSRRGRVSRRARQRRYAGVEFAGDDRRRRRRQRRQDAAARLARRRRRVARSRTSSCPANAVATVGQTSLLGSMHLALDPPPGEAPNGRLTPGATIGLNEFVDLPVDRADAVVAGGGRQRRRAGPDRRHHPQLQRRVVRARRTPCAI